MVVDGHSVFAEALALAIDTTGELTCVGTARDTAQALTLAAESRTDVAVMDAEPEGCEPMRGARRLLERLPLLRVLVLTGQELSPALVRDVAASGACGILPKSASLAVVVATIPALMTQSVTVERSSLVSLCEGVAAVTAPRRAGPGGTTLTRRELDVLSLLASGVDLQRAAARLGITINTARGYVKNLYRKLDVHNQLELLAVVRERGLLETQP
jgi:two-component system nitrate/nitrite response regulator NarL